MWRDSLKLLQSFKHSWKLGRERMLSGECHIICTDLILNWKTLNFWNESPNETHPPQTTRRSWRPRRHRSVRLPPPPWPARAAAAAAGGVRYVCTGKATKAVISTLLETDSMKWSQVQLPLRYPIKLSDIQCLNVFWSNFRSYSIQYSRTADQTREIVKSLKCYWRSSVLSICIL